MAKYLMFALIALGAISCKKAGDSAEMKLYREKKAEVEALRSELETLREKIAEVKVQAPEVPVEQLKKELEEKSAAITTLKSEFLGLQKSEKEAREKLAEYKRKYPLGGE